MTVIYVPRQEGHNISPIKMKDVIALTDTINPYEQKQYKRFIFCNMTATEEEIVRRYLRERISEQVGVPQKNVFKGQPEFNYIYIADIGHIKMR